MLPRMWRKWIPLTLLVEMSNGTYHFGRYFGNYFSEKLGTKLQYDPGKWKLISTQYPFCKFL